MDVRRSPYTILGLRPGADREAIDEAYRRLIKQHHPDISSEDPERAAEINRAYAALRGSDPAKISELPIAEKSSRRAAHRRGSAAGLLMALAALAVLYLLPARTVPAVRMARAPAVIPEGSKGSGADTFALRSLPDEDAVYSAVATARRMREDGTMDQIIKLSRSCEEDLRTYPNPSLLDHCVAFDTASALLAGRSAGGRFRAEDMAARHVRSALRMSNDVVLAEERVESVRRTAEKMVLGPEPR